MNTSSASLSASESTGFFGAYGGQFVPDDLKARLDEVTEAFDRYSDNSFFKDELDYYFKHYTHLFLRQSERTPRRGQDLSQA